MTSHDDIYISKSKESINNEDQIKQENSNPKVNEVYDQLQQQLRMEQDKMIQQREALFRETIQNQISQSASSQNLSSNSISTWSFTQGLILGQLSVILVIGIFIKFFVFAESSPASSTSTSLNKDVSGVITKRDKKLQLSEESDNINNIEDDQLHSTHSKLSTILEKTYYDVDNHSPESLDWFNVLIAQTISQLRTEALLSDNIYHSLNEFLVKLDMPDYLDKIRITEIDIGDDFPIFSNCRIKHSKDGSGRLEAKIDVDLSDTLTLGIETKLLLNHPRPLTAVLPVLLSVSIVRFSGCLTVSLINTNDPEFLDKSNTASNSPSNSKDSPMKNSNSSSNNNNSKPQDHSTGTALMFSFSPDYRLEFTVKSLIGSRAKLQDVPKISSLIENKLRSWFVERCIEPRFQVVKLPSLWPRRKNTREPVHSNVNGIVDQTEESI